MEAVPEDLDARREFVAGMAARGMTVREIAEATGLPKTTVGRDLQRWEKRERQASYARAGQDPPRRPETPNLRHGTGSELVVAPIRQRHLDALVVRYPWAASTARLIFLADLLAKVELADNWLSKRPAPGIVLNAEGDVPDIVVKSAQWGTKAAQLERELDAEARERGGAGAGASLDAIADEILEAEEAAA